jgi:hypothetical protein
MLPNPFHLIHMPFGVGEIRKYQLMQVAYVPLRGITKIARRTEGPVREMSSKIRFCFAKESNQCIPGTEKTFDRQLTVGVQSQRLHQFSCGDQHRIGFVFSEKTDHSSG